MDYVVLRNQVKRSYVARVIQKQSSAVRDGPPCTYVIDSILENDIPYYICTSRTSNEFTQAVIMRHQNLKI